MERKNNFFDKISNSIQKGGEISPFLFVGNPLSQVHDVLYQTLFDLCQKFGVDTNYIFTLKDTGESLKIKDMREFIAKSYQKSPFAFQIFIIENYPRATLEASNTALKFFEEPGLGNLIFITSESEAGILDTILSRVMIERISSGNIFFETNIWESKIRQYIHSNDPEIISLLYQEKLEAKEALQFLFALLNLHKNGAIIIPNIDELESDMQGIEKNNLLPRYIVDKHFLSLK